MVILSVSISNKRGKVLFARQHVPMSRLRIEGLLSAFPKLIESDESSISKQHTFIETADVRYIYQSMDDLYLVLITNLQSNILADLSTLRMIAKLIPDYCGARNEESITQNAFDLLYALDEVIAPNGYQQNVSHQQIKEFVEMDSLNEKLEIAKLLHAEEEALKIMKDKANMFAKQRRDQSSYPGPDAISYRTAPRHPTAGHITPSEFKTNDSDSGSSPEPRSDLARSSKQKIRGNGMRLMPRNNADRIGKAADEYYERMIGDVNIVDENDMNESGSELSAVQVLINEKLFVSFDRDGGLKKFEIKGDLEVIVNDPESTQFVMETNINPNKKLKFGKPTWKLHPRMDSNEWKKGVLCLKDKQKKFKVGKLSKTAILKWRMTANDPDEKDVPINIVFWPDAESDGTVSVNAQYQCSMPIKNVVITFPTPSRREPENIVCEDGSTVFDGNDGELRWMLNDLDAESEGSLEYVVKGIELEDLYPISVHFEMENTYSKIEITGVHDIADAKTFEHDVTSSCVAGSYKVEY